MSRMSVIIDYTNWRGERKERRIQPINMQYTDNKWHTDSQWLLEAIDLSDRDYPVKSFAMKDIHSWKPDTT